MSVRILFMIPIALLAGCSGDSSKPATAKPKQPAATTTAESSADADIKAERDKLSPADRELVETQEWCPIQDDERLGSMGAPVKVMIKDKPVFLCCNSCKKKAEAEPDKTLAKVEELKAKKKTNPPK